MVAARLVAFALALATATPTAQDPGRSLAVRAPVGPNGQMQPLYTGSYALLIGVSRYDVPTAWPRLDSIPGELDELARALTAAGFDRVEHVTDPTGEDLRRAVREFMRRHGYQSGARLLFFFAGHGHTLDQGERGFFVPRDAPDPSKDEPEFRSTALSMQQISTWAGELVSRHALFAFDSCFSGTIFTSRDRVAPVRITTLTEKPTRQFMAAGSAGETVPSKSIFTPTFIRGISGAADLDADGYVTGSELGYFVGSEVLKFGGGRQTPQFGRVPDPRFAEGDIVFVVPGSAAAKAQNTGQSPTPAPGSPGSGSGASSDLVAESARRTLNSRGIAWNVSSVSSAFASGDVEILDLFLKGKAEPGLFLEALGGITSSGTTVAQAFFERAKRNPKAIQWLNAAMAGGLDPNATIKGPYYEAEGLLNSAIRSGNAEAILALVDAGASAHPYQELWLTPAENTRFVDPFSALIEHETLTIDEKKRIVTAFLKSGGLIPGLRKTSETTNQEIALTTLRTNLTTLLGVPVPPAPSLRRQSQTLCQALSRIDGQMDWCAFVQRTPVEIAAAAYHPEWSSATGPSAQPSTPYYDFFNLELLGLVNVVHGKAYFLATERVLFGLTFDVVEVSNDGRLWRVFRFQSPRAGMGLCRKEPDGYQPDRCWRRIAMTYDAAAHRMLVENYYSYDVWMGK